MDDELYPRSGEYADTFFQPTEPEEQVRKRAAAKSRSVAGKDMAKEIIRHLQNRIAFYRTIDSIPDESIKDELAFRIHVAANKQTIANLQGELNFWKGVLKNTK